MAFDPILEEGESRSADIQICLGYSRRGSRPKVFKLVLTDRAAYWPEFKFGPFDRGFTTRRMPLSEIVSVSDRKVFYWRSLMVGVAILVTGLTVVIRVIRAPNWDFAGIRDAGTLAVPFGIGLIFGSLVIAASGGWRRTLVIASERARFTWIEPRMVGDEIDEQVAAAFESVRHWAQKSRLQFECHQME
jgi:hypothetical protein